MDTVTVYEYKLLASEETVVHENAFSLLRNEKEVSRLFADEEKKQQKKKKLLAMKKLQPKAPFINNNNSATDSDSIGIDDIEIVVQVVQVEGGVLHPNKFEILRDQQTISRLLSMTPQDLKKSNKRKMKRMKRKMKQKLEVMISTNPSLNNIYVQEEEEEEEDEEGAGGWIPVRRKKKNTISSTTDYYIEEEEEEEEEEEGWTRVTRRSRAIKVHEDED